MFGAPRASLKKCIRLVDDVRAAVVTLPLAQVDLRLLPFVALHHLLNLLFHFFEVERGGLLHRRVVDERLCRCGHCLLHLTKRQNSRGEVSAEAAAQIVQSLPRVDGVRSNVGPDAD
jgi:hypothetical protein